AVNRKIEQIEELAIPGEMIDVEQHGARSVAGVGGVHAAVGQLPNQPAIDRAEEIVAPAQAGGDGGAISEQPFELAGGERRVEVESGLVADERDGAIVAQFADLRVAAAALPDDGGHDRLAGAAVPDDEGLGLVGDAEAGDLYLACS